MNTMLQYGGDLSQRLSLDADCDQNNNANKINSMKDKYSLRPRSSKRSDADNIPISTITKTRSGKPKQKPPPLSKYRRKTANARERTRMKEINDAFEALRRVVPQLTAQQCCTNEKLTKITTLRLAMKYISTLSATLKVPSCSESSSGCDSEFGDLLSDCSDLDCLLLESDGESLQVSSDLSNHSITPPDFAADFTERMNFGMSPIYSQHFDQLFSELS